MMVVAFFAVRACGAAVLRHRLGRGRIRRRWRRRRASRGRGGWPTEPGVDEVTRAVGRDGEGPGDGVYFAEAASVVGSAPET